MFNCFQAHTTNLSNIIGLTCPKSRLDQPINLCGWYMIFPFVVGFGWMARILPI